MLDEPLTPPQQRVLGCLVEKEATVPDTYPLTLKSLTSACNQQNNRDPVTDFTESEVQRTLDELKARRLARFVHPSHGARSTKFRHVLDEQLGLESGPMALVAVLLLRGPNTTNELRVRTERYHRFADNDEVESVLADLADRDEPIVVRLPPGPGQSQARWMHLLGGPVDAEAYITAPPEGRPAERTGDGPAPAARSDLAARVEALEARVAHLESVLEAHGVSPSRDESTGGSGPSPESGD